MQLLLQLQSSTSGGLAGGPKLGQMLQRLWPFFRHPLTSVRLAAARLLASVVASAGQSGSGIFIFVQPTAAMKCCA